MVAGLLGLLAYLVIFALAAHLFGLWALDSGVLIWKCRRDLREPMQLRAVWSAGRAR